MVFQRQVYTCGEMLVDDETPAAVHRGNESFRLYQYNVNDHVFMRRKIKNAISEPARSLLFVVCESCVFANEMFWRVHTRFLHNPPVDVKTS